MKEKSAFAELLGSFGCAVIVVFGAAVSIVQVKLAGDASGCRRRRWREPRRCASRRTGRCRLFGEAQEDQPPLSSWHSNVEPPSEAVKEKDAPVAFVGSLGCAVIVVFGAAVS